MFKRSLFLLRTGCIILLYRALNFANQALFLPPDLSSSTCVRSFIARMPLCWYHVCSVGLVLWLSAFQFTEVTEVCSVIKEKCGKDLLLCKDVFCLLGVSYHSTTTSQWRAHSEIPAVAVPTCYSEDWEWRGKIVLYIIKKKSRYIWSHYRYNFFLLLFVHWMIELCCCLLARRGWDLQRIKSAKKTFAWREQRWRRK